MCGPNDIATANSVSVVKMPTRDDIHARAIARARAETPSKMAASAAVTTTARSKLVIFTNERWSDHPKSIAMVTIEDAANAIHAARLTRGALPTSVARAVRRASRHDRTTAVAASTAIVNPGNNQPSA